MGMLENYNNIYKMNKAREQDMIKKAIIVFDTNTILKLYSYTQNSLDIFFENICKKLKNRLWIPGRVKYEFLKNREKVIKEQIENIKKMKENFNIINKTDEIKNNIENFIQKYDSDIGLKNSDFKEIEDIMEDYKQSYVKIKQRFNRKSNSKIEKLEKLIVDDFILMKIEKHFKFGDDSDTNWEKENLDYMQKRFLNEISPGYMDNNKKGIDKYGDCILWLQIIEYAKSVKKDIILVTDDAKEDWLNNALPKNDLLKEFSETTKQKFWLYNISEFWNIINNNLGIDIQALIAEDSEIKVKIETKNEINTTNSVNRNQNLHGYILNEGKKIYIDDELVKNDLNRIYERFNIPNSNANINEFQGRNDISINDMIAGNCNFYSGRDKMGRYSGNSIDIPYIEDNINRNV
jgi:hypothetical protein